MTRQTRISSDSFEAAKLKSELHKIANARLKRSLANGFWIEAICIEESIICDRIESVLHTKTGSPRIGNLAPLVLEVIASGSHSLSDQALFEELKAWINNRNIVVHELVKVSLDNMEPWEEREFRAEKTALEGQRLARQVKNWSRRRSALTE